MATERTLGYFSLIIIPLLFCNNGKCDVLTASIDSKITSMQYSGDTSKDTLFEYGLSPSVQYFDRLRLNVGYKQLRLNNSLYGRYNQSQTNLGITLYQYLDIINSRTSLYGGYTNLTSNSRRIGEVSTFGLSALNYRRTFYVDLFYNNSDYAQQQAIPVPSSVQQFSSAIEFLPWMANSWLSLQGIMTENAQANRSENYLYSAIIEWTQYTASSNYPLPERIVIGTQLGEANYLVLHRINSVSNNPDLQTSSYWLSVNWKPGDAINMGLDISQTSYETSLNEKYRALLGSIYLNYHW